MSVRAAGHGLIDEVDVRTRRDKDVEDRGAAPNRLGKELGSFDDERIFLPSRGTLFDQAAQALDGRALRTEPAQDAC
jgi:hypothetical protein